MLDCDPSPTSNHSENHSESLSRLKAPKGNSAISELIELKQDFDKRLAKLPSQERGFIDENLAVLQLGNELAEKAFNLSCRAKTRAERKAAENVRGEIDKYELVKKLAGLIVSEQRSPELLKRLEGQPDLLDDSSSLSLVAEVVKTLLEEACKNPGDKTLEALQTGITCAECIYERGQKLGDPGKESHPGATDGPGLLSRYYQILSLRFAGNIPEAVRKIMRPIEVRALREHTDYLKTLAGCHHRVVDNQETIAVFRTYFLADSIGSNEVYCDIPNKAPGFAVHLAACGGSVNSEEYAEALSEALCQVGDWIWKCWNDQADYSEDPEGEFERAIDGAAIHLSKYYGENFQGTVREVARLLNRREPGAVMAKEKYKKRQKESYHDVIIETFQYLGYV